MCDLAARRKCIVAAAGARSGFRAGATLGAYSDTQAAAQEVQVLVSPPNHRSISFLAFSTVSL